MKVLLLGDYSNYHAALARGLKAIGHDVTVASDGCTWLGTECDIDLSRRAGRIGGARLYMRMLTTLAPRLRGYDVVQLRDPSFVDLRHPRLRAVLSQLKRSNGSIYLSALSTDSNYVRNLTSAHPALPYSEWQTGTTATPWSLTPEAHKDSWLEPPYAAYCDWFYTQIDGAVSALYEYHKVISADYPALPLAYGGIPVETEALPAPAIHGGGRKLRVLWSPHRNRAGEKGADILLGMLRRFDREHPGRIEIVAPPNMPYNDFIRTLAGVDIVCDQLYSLTPATTALLAMAMGVVPISGGEREYYDFIGYSGPEPIFNPDPRDLDGTYRRLVEFLLDADAVRRMSALGPAFVRENNDYITVARRFEDFWHR